MYLIQELILFLTFMAYIIYIVNKYYGDLSKMSKFITWSFFICFFAKLTESILLRVIFGEQEVTDDSQFEYRLIMSLGNIIYDYIYLKFCFIIYHMYKLYTTIRFTGSSTKTKLMLTSIQSKFRMFMAT